MAATDPDSWTFCGKLNAIPYIDDLGPKQYMF